MHQEHVGFAQSSLPPHHVRMMPSPSPPSLSMEYQRKSDRQITQKNQECTSKHPPDSGRKMEVSKLSRTVLNLAGRYSRCMETVTAAETPGPKVLVRKEGGGDGDKRHSILIISDDGRQKESPRGKGGEAGFPL